MSLTKKEWWLVGFVIGFLLLVINMISYFVIVSYLDLSIYDPSYEVERERFIKDKDRSSVHPFYGHVHANNVGFKSEISTENSFLTVSPKPINDEIKILILGGSVASHLSMTLASTPDFLISRALNERFNTDQFVVYNAAFGSAKQPQQYFKLMYLDLLGFRPDLIINYDGFNEIVFPFAENLERGLNAIYPRSFDRAIVSTASEGECIKVNNWLLSTNSYIPVLELIKWIFVRKCHNEVTGSERKITLTDPEIFGKEKQNYLKRVVNVWAESSNRIAQFSDVKGIPYIHVIQPNQYLAGSKPLSKQEEEEFYNYEKIKKPIEAHFEKLKITDLQTPNTLDQRWIFKSEYQTVYSDNCCHFNRLGMGIIVEDLISNFEPIFTNLLSK